MSDPAGANDEGSETRTFRCPPSAIWLPRILAASVLVSALLVAYRLRSWGGIGGWTDALAPFIGLVGALTALWLIRHGGEVRRHVLLGRDGLVFREARSERLLRWNQIHGLRWQAPFAARGFWLSALGILDTGGLIWRVPSVIADGPCLLHELLRQSERSDLRSWADALSIESRLRRGAWNTRGGYVVAGIILIAGGVFYLR